MAKLCQGKASLKDCLQQQLAYSNVQSTLCDLRDMEPFAKMMLKEQSQTQEQTNQEERQISDSLSESKKHETNKKKSKKTVRQN